MRKIILFAPLVFLAACSTAQIQNAQTDISAGITAACADVNSAQMQAATLAPSSAKVASLSAYATAACGTATVAAALVQNSSTLEWLGSLQGQLKAVSTAAPVTVITPITG